MSLNTKKSESILSQHADTLVASLHNKNTHQRLQKEIQAESKLQYSNRSSFSVEEQATSVKEKATIQSQFSQVDEVASGSDSEYSMF